MLNLFNIGKNLTYTMDANISDVIKSKDEASLKLTRWIKFLYLTVYIDANIDTALWLLNVLEYTSKLMFWMCRYVSKPLTEIWPLFC